MSMRGSTLTAVVVVALALTATAAAKTVGFVID